MLDRRTLLALGFTLCFCFAGRPARAQDFCSEVVGMSVCDPAYPSAWANCVADDVFDACLAYDSWEACIDVYYEVFGNAYSDASRDCGLIADECALIGGTLKENGGCAFPDRGGGDLIADADWGGGSSCYSEYVYLDVDYGYGWVTIWEGWATVCELY